MSKLNFYVVLSGNQVTVNYEGQTYHVVCDEEKDADKLYLKAIKAKDSQDATAISAFVNTMKPDYKEVAFEGIKRSRAGNFYLDEYNIPIPTDIVHKMKEFNKKDFPLTPLVNFTKQLLLNPDLHVRRDLFKFAERFKFPITDNGYFIAYKSVAWKGEQKRHFGLAIANKFTEVRAGGDSTDDLFVFSTGPDERLQAIFLEEDKIVDYMKEAVESFNFDSYEEYDPIKWMKEHKYSDYKVRLDECKDSKGAKKVAKELGFVPPVKEVFWQEKANWQSHGTLEEAFESLKIIFEHEVPTFTDFHTGTMTITLGEPVKMKREDCDNDPNRTCSSGLHVGAPGYVKSFGSGSRQYVIACLINPMHVVAIPEDYNHEKMRCCEYFPYAISEFDNKSGVLNEVDTQYFESDYTTFEKAELEKLMEDLKKREGVEDVNAESDEEKEETAREQLKLIRNRLVELK